MLRFSKYARNVYWQASGSTLAQFVNIISLPFITRFFSPTDLGTLGLFMQYLGLFTILISFRFEQLIVLPLKHVDAQKLTRLVIKLGLASCVLWTIICAAIMKLPIISDQYDPWVMMLPFTAYIMVVAQVFQQFDHRSGNFKSSGLSEFINRLTNSCVSLTAGVLAWGGIWLWFAVSVGQFCKAVMFNRHFNLLLGSLPSDIRIGLNCAKQLKLFKLSGSLIFSHAMLAITTIVLLSFVALNWTSADTGYLSLVMSTLALPSTLIGNAVGQVFYQQASYQFSRKLSFDDLMISNVKLLIIIAVPAFSLIFFFGPLIYTTVFGGAWVKAGEIASYYSVAAAFSFLTSPFDRSGIVVNAWWYGPSWHFLRLTSTLVIVGVAWFLNLDFEEFIFLYVFQLSAIYVIDAVASFCFSRRTTPFGTRDEN